MSNPPFVIGPGSTRYAYRDSGRPGDAVCAELAGTAADLLTEGGTRQEWLAGHPDPLLAHLAPARGLRLTQLADHDGDDWTVQTQIVTQTSGLGWAQELDPIALALVCGADGRVAIREQLAVLAAAFDTPEPALAAMAIPVVTQLVERGFLLPGELPGEHGLPADR